MIRLSLNLAIVFFLLLSCKEKKGIVELKDFEFCLQEEPNVAIQNIDAEIMFWEQRFSSVPDDLIARSKIAGLLTRRFNYSAKIEEIHQADSLLKLVNSVNRVNSSSTFRSLAANCITQHQFRQAQLYIDSALTLGDDRYLSVLMQFDIAIELGNLQKARQALQSLTDKKSFEYLIREAKFKDHADGNIEEAIKLMETALVRAREIPNKDIQLWTLSNLADMYGHANRFTDSYKLYLEVLKEDPRYYHALKGIAWLAFSKDKNPELSMAILKFLRKVHPAPDYDLLMAEIADTQNDTVTKDELLQSFDRRVSNYLYGSMYNKYLFNLHAGEWNNPSEALKIAEAEVQSRPTGETFSWLAWAYLINNQKEKSLETIKYHVENKSFEPECLYLVGKIYMNTGNKEKAAHFLRLAKESSYELGPSISKEINNSLSLL